MTLKQLEAFVKIANNKSFTLAAKELFITQPTVSAYINNLEEELGARLFDRTTKEVQLSEEGDGIYMYAKEMLELADKIQRSFLKDENEKKVKQVVISTSSIPGQFLVPEILSTFKKKFPKVEFKVRETDSAGVVEDITNHMADIGLAGTEINTSKCNFIPFYDDELILVTENSEKYRKIKATQAGLNWIRDEDFIMRETGSGTRREAMKLLESCGISQDELKISATFGKTVTVINAVINGLGIAIMSKLAVTGELERGELLEFELSKEGGYRKLYMVTEKKNRQSDGCKDIMRIIAGLYKVNIKEL
ncbi:MAG: selenium metabolism-associated LysR family transcriptional regulator [Catonella sp.]|uniref:selenium metabolism-associated LysR family transcriptional regulator n=1 Tax=Catonella sp. TaxID=2382125 RepID=UPI003FA0751C